MVLSTYFTVKYLEIFDKMLLWSEGPYIVITVYVRPSRQGLLDRYQFLVASPPKTAQPMSLYLVPINQGNNIDV